jgi:hypothetical protein
MSDKKKTHKVIIPRAGIASGEGKPRAIYSPATSAVIGSLGTTETTRASHVEPGSGLSHKARKLLDSEYTEVVEVYGAPVIIREEFASHWFADMTPTGHDVVLGPYDPDKRDQALKEEVEWLNANNIPTCGPCTEKQHADSAVDSEQAIE